MGCGNSSLGSNTVDPDYLMAQGNEYAQYFNTHIVSPHGVQTVNFPNAGQTIQYAYAQQTGYYPTNSSRVNEDSFLIEKGYAGEEEQILFGVFDGHGIHGSQCSRFVRDKMIQNLKNDAHFFVSPGIAMRYALLQTNSQLVNSDLDVSLSGTTAVVILLRGQVLTIANVGDSRAILVEKCGKDYVAQDLTNDQTPFRPDERERIKSYGARVLTRGQLDGITDPNIMPWAAGKQGCEDPPRVWSANAQYPGTAFTRSIGDASAEQYGVIAEPEVSSKQLSEDSAYLILATDGVFEFLSSQQVVDIVCKYDSIADACSAVVQEAYRLWLKNDCRTDDITIVIAKFQKYVPTLQIQQESLQNQSDSR